MMSEKTRIGGRFDISADEREKLADYKSISNKINVISNQLDLSAKYIFDLFLEHMFFVQDYAKANGISYDDALKISGGYEALAAKLMGEANTA